MTPRALLCGTALAALPFVLATPALACTESPSGTYTCTANPSAPVDRGGDNDITVTVDAGAVVTGGADAGILANSDLEVTNAGTVQSDGEHAIEANDRAEISNTGTISSTDKDAVNVDNDLALTNSGTLSAGDDGVSIGNRADIENLASGRILADDKGITGEDDAIIDNKGLIDAGDKAITVEDGADVTNSGTILAGTEGVEAGDDAIVTNLASGVIRADEDGVQVGRNASITNHGLIESTGSDGDGLDIDDGTVINTGTITAAALTGAGIDVDGPFADAGDPYPGPYGALVIDNSGLIQGNTGILVETHGYTEDGEDFYPNVQSQIVTNTGTIRGTGGTALNLGMGADSLLLGAGSVVDGVTLLGGDDDLLSFYETGYSDGFASLFDGGDGTDEVYFAFSDGLFQSVSWLDDVLTLAFDGGAGTFDIALTNFETYTFEGVGGPVSYSTADLVAQIAAVPLPAAFWLMGLGLGGLTLVRRRRA